MYQLVRPIIEGFPKLCFWKFTFHLLFSDVIVLSFSILLIEMKTVKSSRRLRVGISRVFPF